MHEGEVLIWVTLPADAESAELVKPGEAALHDPALGAQTRSVAFTAAGDQWLDAASPELAAVLVVVIASVSEQPIGALARAADLADDRDDAIDQRQELGDVVAVPTCKGDRQRQPAGVGQQVVL